MRCDWCENRIPYAEVYIFNTEYPFWQYICKTCYIRDRTQLNSNGYYILTRLERFSVAFGFTELKWKIIKFWWEHSARN